MTTQDDRNYAAAILEEEAHGQDKGGQPHGARLRAVAEELRAFEAVAEARFAEARALTGIITGLRAEVEELRAGVLSLRQRYERS